MKAAAVFRLGGRDRRASFRPAAPASWRHRPKFFGQALGLCQRAGNRRAELVSAVSGKLAFRFERRPETGEQKIDRASDRLDFFGSSSPSMAAILPLSLVAMSRRSVSIGFSARPRMSQMAKILAGISTISGSSSVTALSRTASRRLPRRSATCMNRPPSAVASV
ncbi:hypothetical protein AJ87_28675 [Rhizobium yanglingense]|nr:hypothetical protein AJ87_28675 [Rhizobium yanglingense]